MRIHKLVVSDFKSYKGQTEIDFGANNFSAIIGPNGVGKSNLMDAISFVFGSSLVELRTKTFSDLVWRDPEHDDVPSKVNSYVEAHFDDRIIRRAIEGSTPKYFVDEEETSEKEYLENLDAIGISKHKNSLVFQGSIERLASLTPAQLAAQFEEISGSSAYKAKYDELAKDLLEKKQILTDLGRARTKQINVVKRLTTGKEAARDRARLTALIDKSTLQETCLRVAALECRINEIQRDIKQLTREKGLVTKGHKSSSKEVVTAKKQLVKAIKDIQKTESELRDLINKSQATSKALMRDNSDIASTKDKLDEIEPKLVAGGKEVEMLTNDVAKLEKFIQSTEKGFEKLLAEVPEYDGDMAIYRECKQQFDLETSLEQTEIDAIDRKIAALKVDLESMRSQADAHQNRTNQIRRQHQVAKLAVDESEGKLERYVSQKSRLENERSKLSTDLSKLRSSINTQQNSVRSKAERLKEMQNDKRRTDQRNSLLERIQKLKRKFPGVAGALYTLVRPKEDRFTVAVDLILGGNFNAVVVDNVVTAKQCIEYASENNLGVMTFLPLDGLEPRSIDSRLRSLEGARLAIDAVDFDRTFSSVVAYACGDTVLCDSSDVAYSLRPRHKVKLVSIDGTVLHSNGVITAGGFETNRFDKTRAASLRIDLMDLMEKLKSDKNLETSLASQLFAYDENLEQLRANNEGLKEKLALDKTALEAFDEDLAACNSQQHNIDSSIASIEEEIQSCNAEQENIEAQFSSLKKRVFEPFTKTTTVDINRFQKALRSRTQLIADRTRQLDGLQGELSYSKSKLEDVTERVESLKEQQKHLISLEGQIQERIEQNSSKLKGIEEAIPLKQQKLRTDEATLEVLNTQFSELQGEELDKNEEKDEIQERIAQLDKLLAQTEEQRELIEDPDEEYTLELIEELETSDAVQKEISRVQSEVHDLAAERERLPVSTEGEDVREAEETLENLSGDYSLAQTEVGVSERQLEKVRAKRLEKFNEVFEPVQEAVGTIYKELTTTKIDPLGGSASLIPLNEKEPYLEGIKFSAMPPKKPFTAISLLSGGEKTIAALSLVFALNTYRSSPIYVLDEVDAALDYANVHLVARYIQRCAEQGSQFVVISLKLWFFEHADNLLGVYRAVGESGSKLISYALSAES